MSEEAALNFVYGVKFLLQKIADVSEGLWWPGSIKNKNIRVA